MSPYSIPVIITAALILFIGRIVYSRNKTSRTNIVFAFLCLSLCFWLLGYASMYSSLDKKAALFWARIGFTAISFIPVFAFHFVCLLTRRPQGVFLLLFYLFIPVSVVLGWTDLVYCGVAQYFWGYYPVAGRLYFVFLCFCGGLFSAGALKLYRASERSRREERGVSSQQYRYVFYAFLIAMTGLIDYVVKFRIAIYPFGYLSALGFIGMIAYAIIKYRLMDVSIAFTRAGIFVTVYTLVLGIPVLVGFKTMGSGPWILPVALMAFLATGGPFVYLYLQKKAEEKLLREQRRYQATLIQASSGMGKIKEIRKLLKLIVRIVTRAVRVEHSAVYILDKEQHGYVLGASLSSSRTTVIPETLPGDSSLVEVLVRSKGPVLVEEEHKKAEERDIKGASVICSELAALHAALVVPSLIESRLVAFLVLGAKTSGKQFSTDDLSVFTILANQSALAIENALFYEDVKRTQEQLFKAEKMATIGTMADGLSHQINNRLHAMGFIAGDMQDTLDISSKKGVFSSPELKQVEQEFTYALSRLQENVTRGGEIVQGLMKYTRRGEEGKGPCDINKVFDAAYEMVQFKIKTGQMKIVKEYDLSAPVVVHGNFTQLQEVFFNLIDNGFDAMMQRKNELAEPGYQPTLTVCTATEGDKVRIVFSDNGIGVKEEDKHKLFTPFFTTKATAKKGTGLGLYVIRKIVEDNHGGRVEVDSTYMSGTKMIMTVSAVKGEG